MTFSIYNTLTCKKEAFEPLEPGQARVYACGPTVYDLSHIGHARSVLVYDLLVRHLRHSGLRVTYVRNVTDINDKITKRAAEMGETPEALAERFFVAFKEDMRALGTLEPDVEPRVSEHLAEIKALIQTLMDKGHAYESAGDVYFSVSSCPDYGKLSHKKLDELESGASERVDVEETERKRDPADFALWKKSTEGQPGFESAFSRGRPGWHIECSAMSMRHLGETFDIHGGGLDLVFPHHENEIAQSECATGKTFARYWMHNGFVQVQKEKMSKSLGNFFVLRQAYQCVEPEAVRYAMLTVHYRAPLNFEWEVDDAGKLRCFPLLDEAEARLEYVYATRQRLLEIPNEKLTSEEIEGPAGIAAYGARMTEALDDDLNTPVALAHTALFLKQVNELCVRAQSKKGRVPRAWHEAAVAGFAQLGEELGIGEQDPEQFTRRVRNRRAKSAGIEPGSVEEMLRERTAARANKDYQRSDAIRDELVRKGVELYDSPSGTDWRLLRSST